MNAHRLNLSLLLATLAGFAYLNALHGPFVYDDRLTVIGNASLRTPTNVAELLGQSAFRPVVNFSYAFDYALWGLRPFGFHLASLVWHMLNVTLLFWVAVMATEDWRRRDPARASGTSAQTVALVAASLLAVHPMMTEAVEYVSGRSEVLCGVFMAASLLASRAALASGRVTWLAAGLAAGALAAGSKEIGLMVPFVLFVWDRLLLAPVDGPDRRRLRWLPVALMSVTAVGALVRLAVFFWVEPPNSTPLAPYLASQVRAFWRYVSLLVVPASQSLVHPIEPTTSVGPETWLGAIALVAVLALVFRARHAQPLVALGAAWFILLLLPSSVVPLAEVMAE